MKESLLSEELFRRSFIVAMIVGIICRGLVLRVTDKQYPSRPQDYLEQIITSGLAASLGSIALPALMDKEFSALTFFAIAIQQFQGLARQEKITIENVDKAELVPKGSAYVEEISSTYESRSYISLLSALAASVTYIILAKRYDLNFIMCTLAAATAGAIVGILFRRYLRRDSIGDIADVVPAKITFDGPILKINDVYISNIGLKDIQKRYLQDGLAVQIIPRDLGKFGIVNDIGQRNAILHNIYLHLGIDKDVDEKDILAISKSDLDTNTVVLPFIPLLKDMDEMIRVIKSTPVIETAKGNQSAYKLK